LFPDNSGHRRNDPRRCTFTNAAAGRRLHTGKLRPFKMKPSASFLTTYRQNSRIPIRLIAPDFGHLPVDVLKDYGLTHRKTHYFFIFVLNGHTRHGVDLEQFDIGRNELLFILPNQIHQLPGTRLDTEHFKLGLDEDCLSLLPKPFPFLLNPLNRQKICLSSAAAIRLRSVFEILKDLLGNLKSSPELVLAHLNSLLSEINASYFEAAPNPANEDLSRFIRFKLLVEETFCEHPAVTEIAAKLNLNTNSLYNIVRHYSGRSPKAFITQRIMLEAKRRLCYSESTSIKELAYDLGFNDPEYFSRLFKKETGKTIAAFLREFSGN
jgi:AraC family transcriptional activator of pobA